MQKVLISACLLGHNTKYNGGNNYKEEVKQLASFCEFIVICPEMDGGLSCPRVPAEINGSKVINKKAVDVTEAYLKGANHALNLALSNGVKYAILKEKSPSCGVKQIYDGTFTGTKINGSGITTRLLARNGIVVFNEDEVQNLLDILKGNKEKE